MSGARSPGKRGIDATWQEHKRAPTEETRSALIRHYSYLAKLTANRYDVKADTDDLQGAAHFGLCVAIDKFDPSRNVKFETFAIGKMRYEILEHLRSHDWVPRAVRTLAKQVTAARSNFTEEYGRMPEDDELRRELCYSEKRWLECKELLSRTEVSSLDQPAFSMDDGGSVLETLSGMEENGEKSLLAGVDAEALWAVVYRLPGAEGEVIARYMTNRESFRVIGKSLGVSETRAWQLYTQGLERLRRLLGHTRK